MEECEKSKSGSQEDFLSHHNNKKEDENEKQEKTDSSEEGQQEETPDENMFHAIKVEGVRESKDSENFDFNTNGTPLSVSDNNGLSHEPNHLNALANLDPSSKFPENIVFQDMRIPQGEEEPNKVFMCHLCDFKTAYANSLMNHQAVHSDIRPWACAMCEYAAKRKQDLKKHLHTVHGMMVESPMLKPVLTNNPDSMPRFLGGMNEGFKDGEIPVEGVNMKRCLPPEQEFPFFPASSSGHPSFPTPKRIKDELQTLDVVSPSHERKTPSSADVEESPDDNLPISFPSTVKPNLNESPHSHLHQAPIFSHMLPHMPSSSRENGEMAMPFVPPSIQPWHMKRQDKLPELMGRDWAQHHKPRENMPFHPGMLRGGKPFNPDSMQIGSKAAMTSTSLASTSSSSQHIRGEAYVHSFPDEENCTIEKERNLHSQSHGATVEVVQKASETDRSITSSSTVSHARSTQTQAGFLCEHCDILFFQRAMYLMHVGLHSPDDPWCCAMCGHSFSEKYSFTSHFINQH